LCLYPKKNPTNIFFTDRIKQHQIHPLPYPVFFTDTTKYPVFFTDNTKYIPSPTQYFSQIPQNTPPPLPSFFAQIPQKPVLGEAVFL